MERARIVVRGAILLLVVLIVFLGFYYWRLITPPTMTGADPGAGITHVVSMYGYGPGQEDQLYGPDGLDADEDGNIYVADSGHSRIMVFDQSGRFLRKFGAKGSKKNQILFPLGVEVHRGRVYVTSMILSKMQIYNLQGKLLREVIMDRPIKVRAKDNRLWITTPGQLWMADLNGNALRSFFRKGKAPGQLNYPNGLDFDSEGNLFVSDTMNNRIQIIDSKGNLKGVKGEPTQSMNQEKRLFGLGMGLAVDDRDRIYVIDAFHSSIRVFDHDGNELAELGEQGKNDGQVDHPSDVAYLGGNRFAIADKNNDRVQILAIDPPARAGEAPPNRNLTAALWALGIIVLLIVSWTAWRMAAMRKRKNQQVEDVSSSF